MNIPTTLMNTITGHPILGFSVGAVLLLVAVALAVRALIPRAKAGAPWFYYLGALAGLSVSLETSYRFLGERLDVTGAERVVMFAAIELGLVACALGMRANVRRIDPETGKPGDPGTPRLVAIVLSGFSTYAALVLSGPVDGLWRVGAGPVLSLVMVHMALGIEVHRRTGRARTGTGARIMAELRERMLSRLGLDEAERSAAVRTRVRAVRTAARLAYSPRNRWNKARYLRVLRRADVATDPATRALFLAELDVIEHAYAVRELRRPSPWTGEPHAAATSTDTPPHAASDSAEVASPIEVADSVVLATDTPPPWTGMTKRAAVERAVRLLPDRSNKQLVTALTEVGMPISEASVRARRTELARTARTQPRSAR